MALPVLLLLLVGTHYAYEPLHHLFGGDEGRWHYILQGGLGAVLFLLVLLVARDWISRGLCVFGLWEQALIAGCGSLRINAAPGFFKIPGDENLCHSALGITGLEQAGLGLLFAFSVVLAQHLYRRRNNHHEPPNPAC